MGPVTLESAVKAQGGRFIRLHKINGEECCRALRALQVDLIHFVDPGVDTGDIVATEPVRILPGDTLQAVRMRVSAQQSKLLARTARAALAGPLPRCPQWLEEGRRQYFAMHPQLCTIAERRLHQYTIGVMNHPIRSNGGSMVTPEEKGSAILADSAG